nr:VWA domain-containing protein [Acidobacteriota bacterium]
PKKDKGGTTAQPAKVASGGAAGEEVDEEDVVRVGTNLVPLPAFVYDARGRAVTDLQLKDFELVVDGEARPLGELSRSETPANVALLFDNSGSLTSARAFQKQAAARFFQTALRPVDRAAVYSISTTPELAHPLTNDFRALVRTVESFGKPEGGTAFFDTVAEAAEYLRRTSGRRVIIVVSDGTDTVSELDFDTTLARLLAAHCQVYAVRVGHSDNTNLRDLAGERRLQEFAAQTGGAIYAPQTRADYEEAFQQIAADLRQQYVLSYYPAGDSADGRFHTFTLRVAARPDLRVRTRKGYYARKK